MPILTSFMQTVKDNVWMFYMTNEIKIIDTSIKPGRKMDDESWMPRAEEPMEDYLKSDRYRRSFTSITFSDFKGQEETNYAFWRHLTPSQRLELHTIMVKSLYSDMSKKHTDIASLNIIFTDTF